MPCAEGEIGLAAAHVREDQFLSPRVVGPPALFCEMRENFQVVFYLAMLVRHGSADPARGIRHFQAMQPVLSARIQKCSLGAIMSAMRRRGESRFVTDQPGLSLRFDKQLPIA